MATIKVRLNTSYMPQDGSCPLVLQLLHRRRKKTIPTPYRLTGQQFDAVSERVVPQRKTAGERIYADEVNRYLDAQKRRLREIVEELSSREGIFDVEEIVRRYRADAHAAGLLDLVSHIANELFSAGRVSSGYSYKSLRSLLVRFGCTEYLPVADITPDFLRRFMGWMQCEGLRINSAALYLRILRATYNRAVERGIADEGRDPFRRLRIRKERTAKRALAKETLVKIARLDLSADPALDFSKDLFLFSFYARGMSFVDMVFLRHSNICRGFIVYRRHKTRQQLRIKMSERLLAIIRKYKRPSSPYIFPVLDEADDPRSSYLRYKTALQKCNRNLKKIGRMPGLGVFLTSYMARHSWATIAKRCGIPISVISEGLGHTSEKTTAIYLDSFEDEVVDRANEIVTALYPKDKRPCLFSAYNEFRSVY